MAHPDDPHAIVAKKLSRVVFVTGNPGKLAEAQRLCDVPLESVDLDLPEIQSLDLEEVLKAKGQEAWSEVHRPLLVEETGLELAGMNGFPGPLVKWMLRAVGAEGIGRAAQATGDMRAVARCALLLVDEENEILAEGTTEGELVLPPRGAGGFGWDPVFVPAGGSQTYAELSPDEKDAVSHRAKAWRDLVEKLTVLA